MGTTNMFSTKPHKQQDQYSIHQAPLLSHKLFVDYPYPILTELEKTYEQQHQKSNHSNIATSLQRYKTYFNRMFGIVHSFPNHESSTVVINGVEHKLKPTRTKREYNGEQNSRKQSMASLKHHIDDDHG